MTVFNLVESVRQIFPSVGETQILGMISKSQKEFAGKCRLLKKTGQLTDPSTNITWSFPNDCKEVTDVIYYDTNDLALEASDLGISYEIVFNKITFVNRDGTKLTGLPASVIYAYAEYVYYPATISATSDTLEIDEVLHGAIEANIYEKLYARFPIDTITQNGVMKILNFNAASYWRGVYKEYEKEGKRIGNIDKDATDYSNIKRDIFGNPLTVRRQRISTTGTIPLSSLSSIYSKYIRFTATEGGSITINEQFGWATSIATPTETSYTITVVSSSEFTTSMDSRANLGVNKGRTDADNWYFELYSGYGTVQCEIWTY